jgi:hypothetical protein
MSSRCKKTSQELGGDLLGESDIPWRLSVYDINIHLPTGTLRGGHS